MIKINNRREEYSILDTFFNATGTISELLLGLDYDKSEEHLFSAFRSKVMEIYAKNVDLSIPVTATYIPRKVIFNMRSIAHDIKLQYPDKKEIHFKKESAVIFSIIADCDSGQIHILEGSNMIPFYFYNAIDYRNNQIVWDIPTDLSKGNTELFDTVRSIRRGWMFSYVKSTNSSNSEFSYPDNTNKVTKTFMKIFTKSETYITDLRAYGGIYLSQWEMTSDDDDLYGEEYEELEGEENADIIKTFEPRCHISSKEDLDDAIRNLYELGVGKIDITIEGVNNYKGDLNGPSDKPL